MLQPVLVARGTKTVRLSLLVGSMFLIAACAKKEEAPIDTSAAMAPPAMAPALNDAQIAHVAVTANAVDSAAGEMAKQMGTAKEVKDFAQTMINDHTGVNKQAVALATKLGVTPEDNDISRGLKAGAEQAAATQHAKSGADFDRAYIDNEVAYHQAVLDALDKTLIPGAQNAELKALLESVRPAVAAHLERAKTIQGTLATKS